MMLVHVCCTRLSIYNVQVFYSCLERFVQNNLIHKRNISFHELFMILNINQSFHQDVRSKHKERGHLRSMSRIPYNHQRWIHIQVSVPFPPFFQITSIEYLSSDIAKDTPNDRISFHTGRISRINLPRIIHSRHFCEHWQPDGGAGEGSLMNIIRRVLTQKFQAFRSAVFPEDFGADF